MALEYSENLYFNEVNTMPGMTAASLYPKMMGAIGVTPEKLVSALIESAVGGV